MGVSLIVITAFISPFPVEHEMARGLIGTEHLIEVFVNIALEACDKRDPKGPCKQAHSRALPNTLVISSAFHKAPNWFFLPICYTDRGLDNYHHS